MASSVDGTVALNGGVGYLRAMKPTEKLVILMFLGSLALLYASAGGMVLRAGWRWAARRRGQTPAKVHSRRYIWLRRVVLALAAVGVLCMAYGRFIEPRWVEVTRVRVESPRLREASRPVRIVQVSDFHCEAYADLAEDVPDIIAGLSPDVIVFTGDSLNDRQGLGRFRRCMTRLAEIAPTLAVRGNWDVGGYGKLDFFGGTGVRELSGEGVRITAAGTDVWFVGSPVGDASKLDAALAAAPDGACKVLLYHYPDPILEVAKRGDVDLQLSGHTHGGQVALPFYGALITVSRHGKRFERGLYEVGSTHLYINRGIGMEGGRAPRVRFCARPEITVIELAPAKAESPVPQS